MQRLSSFSHAWTHVVQYRAQSLVPCPFYHKSQSSEASNHKSTDEATIISLFADFASPSSSSRNHLTALVLLVVLPGCKYGGCLGLQAALANDLPWSPSMVFSVERTSPNHKKIYHRRHRNGEGSQIQLLPPFLYTRPVYQYYNLQRATNTNQRKIDGVSNQGY